jgi:hypothetical protein
VIFAVPYYRHLTAECIRDGQNFILQIETDCLAEGGEIATRMVL